MKSFYAFLTAVALIFAFLSLVIKLVSFFGFCLLAAIVFGVLAWSEPSDDDDDQDGKPVYA